MAEIGSDTETPVVPAAIEDHPVAIIGAGPIGLAAAAHLIERGVPFVIFESGDVAGSSILEWAHVRLFTPWKYLVDAASARLLSDGGWAHPSLEYLPTGAELVNEYLKPLADNPLIRDNLRTGERVTAVGRAGLDKVKTRGRELTPFALKVQDRYGSETEHLASAVIDASGTWSNPNPLGASGMPALGETQLGKRLRYGMPDVLDQERATYAGKETLVVGSGHSSANAVLDLVKLSAEAGGTGVVWAVRSPTLTKAFGGGEADELPARGQVGLRLKAAVESGSLRVMTNFAVRQTQVVPDDRVRVISADGQEVTVDNVIAATGQRPDLSMLREIRLDMDPWLESPRRLAPVIDPNLHHCGSVPPHGFDVLSHPEHGFFVAGVKSYGRAPTFLMMTGYEQVRSIVAAISGDMTSARELHLVLPETGVCIVDYDTHEGPTPVRARGSGPSPLKVEATESACCG